MVTPLVSVTMTVTAQESQLSVGAAGRPEVQDMPGRWGDKSS